jgi:PAS domain S-box-containing protein
MNDIDKTKEQLIKELGELRRRVRETERVEVELKLQSEILYNVAEGVMMASTKDGLIVYTNPTFERMFGYGPGELLNRHVSILNASDEKSAIETADEIIQVLYERGAWSGEILNVKADGSKFWCHAHVSAFEHYKYGNVWVTVQGDITERKQAEEAIQTLVEGTSGIAGQDFFDKLVEEMSEWLGCEVGLIAELIDDNSVRTISMRVDGKTAAEYQYRLHGTPCENVTTKGFCHYAENITELFPEDKDLADMDLSGYVGSPLRNKEGKVVGIICAMSRSSLMLPARAEQVIGILAARCSVEVERRRAENALKASEQFLQTIIDGVAEPLIIIGNGYQMKLLNKTAREQMSIIEAETVTCHKASHHRDTPCVGIEHPCPLEKVRETGQAVTVLHRHYTKEGERRYIEILASPLWKPDGSFEGIIEMNRDITDRMQAEKALFESREFFKNIVELTNAIHWEFDLGANKFTYVSPQSESILGYPPDTWTDFEFWANNIHPDDREWVTEYCRQETEELLGHEFVYRMISNEGNTVWLHDIVHVIAENQKPVSLNGIMFDVTRTKKAEEQIKTSLKEKEVLIQEIHHRVKNNLAVIRSLLSLQAGQIKDEKTKGLFNESQNRVQSMSMIHERLYSTEDLSTVNFGEYIRSLAIQLFRNYEINPSLVNLVISVPDISVDINTMIPCGLILNELISNACKYAFPDDRKGELSVIMDKRDDEYSLIVIDDGIGLPEDIDIYNTESLGMNIVTSLVRQINGKMEVESEGGSKFSVMFREKPFSR